MEGKIGRIADPLTAFWLISKFLMGHPLYRKVPFAQMRHVQRSIELGNYCILGDGKTVQAVATWSGINVAALLRTYPRYVADNSEPIDGVLHQPRHDRP